VVCFSAYFVVQGASSVIIDIQDRQVAVCLSVCLCLSNELFIVLSAV
jgi:hypothetical protein